MDSIPRQSSSFGPFLFWMFMCFSVYFWFYCEPLGKSLRAKRAAQASHASNQAAQAVLNALLRANTPESSKKPTVGLMFIDPLQGLAFDGNFNAFSKALTAKNQDLLDPQENSLLFFAAAGDQPEHLDLLLSRGLDIEHKNTQGLTALFKAAEANAQSAVAMLLDHGASINVQTREGLSMLLLASRHGDVRFAEHLLHQGADVNARWGKGWTPLHYAAQEGHQEIVEMLLAKGADSSARLTYGWTPIDLAEGRKRWEVITIFQQFATNRRRAIAEK